MKSSYLTKVRGKEKLSWPRKHVGAFSDYFIFIVFPLQGPEYVMCIMPALSVALSSLQATCFNKAIFPLPKNISRAPFSTKTEYDMLSKHTSAGQNYTLLKEIGFHKCFDKQREEEGQRVRQGRGWRGVDGDGGGLIHGL